MNSLTSALLIGTALCLTLAAPTAQAEAFPAAIDLGSLDGSNGFTITGKNAYDFSGRSVSGAGDINGDGVDDLIIGVENADTNGDRSGESYVVFGSNAGFSSSLNLSQLNGSNGFAIPGKKTSDGSGRSASGAGDINGDGIDDLIVGSWAAKPNGFSSGESYVIFGSNSGFSSSFDLKQLNGSNGFALQGKGASSISGNSVSGAGDINGDGVDDFIIGAPGVNSSAGESYIVFGSAGGFSSSINLGQLNGSNGFALQGKSANDSSGSSVSGAGDVNGDGFDDLIIGAYRASPNGNASGESYVVYGSDEGFSASLDLGSLDGSNGFALQGKNTSDYFGHSISGAGDINGDGFDDLIIGAENADTNGFNSGESYVIFGSASGFSSNFDLDQLDGSNGFTITGKDAYNGLGTSASGAGDVNGDGFDDLIIGAFGAEVNGTRYAGESYVIFGSASGFSSNFDIDLLDGSNGFTLQGKNEFDTSGISVSGAGDINGDGVDDLIVGADSADPNGKTASGESYVVFGVKTRMDPPVADAGSALMSNSSNWTLSADGTGSDDPDGDNANLSYSWTVDGHEVATTAAPSLSLTQLGFTKTTDTTTISLTVTDEDGLSSTNAAQTTASYANSAVEMKTLSASLSAAGGSLSANVTDADLAHNALVNDFEQIGVSANVGAVTTIGGSSSATTRASTPLSFTVADAVNAGLTSTIGNFQISATATDLAGSSDTETITVGYNNASTVVLGTSAILDVHDGLVLDAEISDIDLAFNGLATGFERVNWSFTYKGATLLSGWLDDAETRTTLHVGGIVNLASWEAIMPAGALRDIQFSVKDLASATPADDTINIDLSHVPEPAAMTLLLGMGAAAAGIGRRRKNG